ncbi:MAG: (2Fe-2S)-binding protein [Chloroflexia bacterium]|nr:(2Fe-2S)-binding protein [Chloroflexia bacterium]
MISANHPLRITVDRLTTLYADVPIAVGVPDESGWVPASAVFAPGSTYLPAMLAAVAAAYQTTHRDLPASFLCHRYNWTVACAAVGAFLIDRRLPSLDLANVAIHLDDQGQGDQIALVSGRFWTSAGDVAAAHPDALIEPSGAIDLTRVRRELERHFEPVIDAIRANAPFGKRAMWLSLADNCAWCLLEFGQRLQRPGSRQREIEEFVGGPDSRLRGGTRLITIEAAGKSHAFVERGSCCLSYKLPETGYCHTCPLLKPEQRAERLRNYVTSAS